MKLTFFKGIALGTAVSVLALGATAAYAGTGTGAVFNIGKFNGVNAASGLGGNVDGPQLSIKNTSGGSSATGVSIKVHSGKAPLIVNSTTKVANLNADSLDGLDATGFVQGSGRIATINVSQANNGFGNVLAIPNFVTVQHSCGASGANGGYQIVTSSAGAVAEFADNGAANPTFLTLSAGSLTASSNWTTLAAGDSIVFSFRSGAKVATVTLFNSPSTSGCTIQGHAIISGA